MASFNDTSAIPWASPRRRSRPRLQSSHGSLHSMCSVRSLKPRSAHSAAELFRV